MVQYILLITSKASFYLKVQKTYKSIIGAYVLQFSLSPILRSGIYCCNARNDYQPCG